MAFSNISRFKKREGIISILLPVNIFLFKNVFVVKNLTIFGININGLGDTKSSLVIKLTCNISITDILVY
jgi:hypothetical protein